VIEFLAAFVVLGIVVFIHELGHFVVARRCGVRVEVFSVGFGPRLCGLKRGDTDYRLSAIPWGGYVKLDGEQYEDGAVPDAHTFFAKPIGQRIAVFAAGAICNFILAYAIYALIFQLGYQEAVWPTTIGTVSDSSPARAAGLVPGDRVVAVDGQAIPDWQEMVLRIASNPGGTARLTVQRDSTTADIPVTIPEDVEEFPAIVGIWPRFPAMVGAVTDSFPAALAGLRRGDRILAIGDTPVASWQEMQQAIAANGRHAVTVLAARDGETLAVQLRPRYNAEYKAVLIGVSLWSEEKFKRYPFPANLWQAARKTADVTKMTVVGIYKLVTLQLNLKAMGGPIMIVTVAAGLAGIGWVEVALFVALISISLGIINLCPFPPTDGWHILMAVLEKIRGRRLAPQTQERVMMAGVYFVLTLFVVVLYNDMMRFGWIERMQEWVIRSF